MKKEALTAHQILCLKISDLNLWGLRSWRRSIHNVSWNVWDFPHHYYQNVGRLNCTRTDSSEQRAIVKELWGFPALQALCFNLVSAVKLGGDCKQACTAKAMENLLSWLLWISGKHTGTVQCKPHCWSFKRNSEGIFEILLINHECFCK